MKYVAPEPGWPSSWQLSHHYDLMEIFGSKTNVAYTSGYHARQRKTLEWLLKSVPEGCRLLDVAAAQGNFSLAAAELGYKVTWNDLREELIPYVKKKHEFGEISYQPGNIFDFPSKEVFDGILITEVIEHVAHPDEFLRQISTLLRPGGKVIMTTPNGAYLLNNLPKFSDTLDPSVFESVQFQPNADGHIFLLHPEEIPALASAAGLRTEIMVHFGNPLSFGHLKLRHFLRLLPSSVVAWMDRVTSNRLPKKWIEKFHAHTICVFSKTEERNDAM